MRWMPHCKRLSDAHATTRKGAIHNPALSNADGRLVSPNAAGPVRLSCSVGCGAGVVCEAAIGCGCIPETARGFRDDPKPLRGRGLARPTARGVICLRRCRFPALASIASALARLSLASTTSALARLSAFLARRATSLASLLRRFAKRARSFAASRLLSALVSWSRAN